MSDLQNKEWELIFIERWADAWHHFRGALERSRLWCARSREGSPICGRDSPLAGDAYGHEEGSYVLRGMKGRPLGGALVRSARLISVGWVSLKAHETFLLGRVSLARRTCLCRLGLARSSRDLPFRLSLAWGSRDLPKVARSYPFVAGPLWVSPKIGRRLVPWLRGMFLFLIFYRVLSFIEGRIFTLLHVLLRTQENLGDKLPYHILMPLVEKGPESHTFSGL